VSESIREIRINPVVPAESVLIATARGMRPRAAEKPAERDRRSHVDSCPFCRGNEARTPPTIVASPDQGDWQIRVIENLFPVLGADSLQAPFALGLQQAIDGYGRHEVVIDHWHHGVALYEMECAHIARLFGIYRDRMQLLYDNDPRLRYVLAFKNFGAAAGASIAHTHSQIIATPVVPQGVQDEVQGSSDYYRSHGHCIFCTLIDEALTFEATIYDRETGAVRRRIEAGQYIVERNDRFVAIKPFASRFEWEVHILPLDHAADFTTIDAAGLASLASLVKSTMGRLDRVIGGAQYNYFLHTLPREAKSEACSDSYHWHLEICPRTSIPSGFELGSGLFVNTVSPEEAAAQLRDVVLDSAG